MENKNQPVILYWTIVVMAAVVVGYFSWINAQELQSSFATNLVNVPKVETENEFIKVAKPKPYQFISSPVVLLGEANVFEAVVSYRLKSSQGDIITQGYTMTAGAFEMNPFRQEIDFTKPSAESGTLEVFMASPKDGSDLHKISIPVYFQ